MSISSTDRKDGPYLCNGSIVDFDFNFKVFEESDLRVVLTDADGAETDLTLTTHYTVSLNADQDNNPGGTVTTVSAYASGYKIILTSDVPETQGVAIANQGGFYPDIINKALDRLTILVQQVSEKVGRAVKVDISSSDTPEQLLTNILAAEVNSGASAAAAAASASAAGTSETNAASSASAAGTSETNAANSASAAGTSETNAANSASAASTSATNASNSASAAATSETNASNSANAAAASASAAGTSATNADNSATAAAASAAAAAASFDSFDDRYLGPKATDPALDNDGNALLEGALYWNTTSKAMMTYDGAAWGAAYIPTAGYATDAELAAAIAAHEAAANPHPTYLTQAEGDAAYATAAQGTTADAAASGLTAHVNDTTDAHDASAISYAGSSGLSAVDVEAALDELDSEKAPNVSTQTAWIPAGAMVPRTTSGATQSTTETTTNKVMLRALDFDAATAEYAQFNIRMPKGWDEGTVKFRFVWTAGNTGGVTWAARAAALSDDDVLDAAWGSAVGLVDAVTAANDLMISAETSAITIGGTPAEGDWVAFEVYRSAADGGDTLTVDARLIGVLMTYGTTSLNDA